MPLAPTELIPRTEETPGSNTWTPPEDAVAETPQWTPPANADVVQSEPWLQNDPVVGDASHDWLQFDPVVGDGFHQPDVGMQSADKAREIFASLGDRRKVLDIWRTASPAERQSMLEQAPAIAESLRGERGGVFSQVYESLAKGIAQGVSQPIMELVGLGGTEEEIASIRQFEQLAGQHGTAARPDDPWYQRGPLQAVEMLPWMLSVVGGGGAAGTAARAAGYGSKGVKVAQLAGITSATFPGAYAQTKDDFTEAGVDEWWAKPAAGLTATAIGLVEGIVPNPFVGKVPLSQGVKAAVTGYVIEAAKRAPIEASEEYLQGFIGGFGRAVSTWLDEEAPDQGLGDAFTEAWNQGNEALLPMMFLLGVPAAGGAGLTAIQAKRVTAEKQRLDDMLDKGFISAEEGRREGLTDEEMSSRATRKDAIERRSQALGGMTDEVRDEGRDEEGQAEETEVQRDPEVSEGREVPPPGVEGFVPPSDGDVITSEEIAELDEDFEGREPSPADEWRREWEAVKERGNPDEMERFRGDVHVSVQIAEASGSDRDSLLELESEIAEHIAGQAAPEAAPEAPVGPAQPQTTETPSSEVVGQQEDAQEPESAPEPPKRVGNVGIEDVQASFPGAEVSGAADGGQGWDVRLATGDQVQIRFRDDTSLTPAQRRKAEKRYGKKFAEDAQFRGKYTVVVRGGEVPAVSLIELNTKLATPETLKHEDMHRLVKMAPDSVRAEMAERYAPDLPEDQQEEAIVRGLVEDTGKGRASFASKMREFVSQVLNTVGLGSLTEADAARWVDTMKAKEARKPDTTKRTLSSPVEQSQADDDDALLDDIAGQLEGLVEEASSAAPKQDTVQSDDTPAYYEMSAKELGALLKERKIPGRGKASSKASRIKLLEEADQSERAVSVPTDERTGRNPETLAQAVRSLGGLNIDKLRSGERVNIDEDIIQAGIRGVLRGQKNRKGKLDLEEMAGELESQGYWKAPEGENKADALLQALKDGVLTTFGDEQAIEREYAEYQAQLEKELNDAREEGVTDAEIAEALRSAEADAFSEAQVEDAEERAAIIEEVDGDTSFLFGANAASVGIEGQQQALFQRDEQGTLFNVSQGQTQRSTQSTSPSELERLTEEQRASKVESLPGQEGLTSELKEMAKKARKEAQDSAKEFFDDIQGDLFSNPFLNPRIVAGSAKVVYKYAKAGALEFAAFVEQLAADIGQASVDKILPVLQSEWDKLQATGEIEGMKPFRTPAEPPPTADSAQTGSVSPTTSIKNDAVNEQREQRGVEPLPEPTPESFDEWNEYALRRYQETGGDIGRALVAEQLNVKTRRNLTERESAILGVHYRTVNNHFQQAAGELFAASESSDPVATASAQNRADGILNTLLEIEQAAKVTGTEAGRSLVSRKMELDQDFSLGTMVTRARVANAGKPLTVEQTKEIADMANRVEVAEKQLQEAQAKIEELERQRQVDVTIKKTPRKTVRKSERRQKAQAKVDAAWAEFASIAKGTLYSNPIEAAVPAAKLVAAYAELGVVSFAEMMSRVGKQIGAENANKVRGVFRDAWNAAREAGDIDAPRVDATNVRSVSRYAQTLTRLAVEGGVTEREAVVDIVHEGLQEVIPEITRRETMDAISGYGQYALLSKGDVDVIVRDIKGQLQQLGKLDDLKHGEAPAKTGVERREPSDEERHLIKQVNEEMRRSGINATDPDSQLRSALQAAKTAARNSISDMQYEMERGERTVRTKTELVPDEELKQLRSERDAVRELHDAMFKPLEEDARVKATERSLDRMISVLEDQIARKDVAFEGKKVAISTPAIDAKRSRLAELKAIREAIRMEQGLTEERARKLYEASLQRRLAEYEQLIADGDFAPRPKKSVRKLSREELEAKRALADVKQEYFRKVAEYRIANLKGAEKALDAARETAHLSRAVLTSIDLSAVFRQGGGVAFSHPVLAANASREMMSALASQENEFASIENIRNHELGHFAETAGLEIAEREGTVTRQEEAFMGRWVNQLAKQDASGAKAPLVVAGKAVAASARAYTTMLNSLRFGLFTHLVENLGRDGKVTLDEAKVIAKFINVSTGRSDLGPAMAWLSNMNALFFAPRYVASRFQYLAMAPTIPFMKTSGRVKKALAMEYARHATGVAAFIGIVAGLYGLLGDDGEDKPTVETDPRSSDFLKIKIGDTRIDPLSGLSQTTVFLSRILSGQKKTATGDIRPLRGDTVRFGDETTTDVIKRFAWSKLAPVPGSVVNILEGENVVGEPVTSAGTVSGMFIPLSFREVKETMMSRGIPEGTAISALALLGMGTATYGQRTQFLTGTPEQRSEQFEKYLNRMQWDSPDPDYLEFLTARQQELVYERRRQKQGLVIYQATYAGNSDSELATSEKSRDTLQEMRSEGVSREEAQILLREYYSRRYPGSGIYELKSDGSGLLSPFYKESYLSRASQLNRIYLLRQ